jgi:hypothetical protein
MSNALTFVEILCIELVGHSSRLQEANLEATANQFLGDGYAGWPGTNYANIN